MKRIIALAALCVLCFSCAENNSPRNPYVAPYGQFTEPILCTVTPAGWLADALVDVENASASKFLSLKAEFEATLDEAIPAYLEDYYGEAMDDADFLPTVEDVEAMLWTYSRTANPHLLDLALASYDLIDPETVSTVEYMKIPILLYGYTGDENFLNVAYNEEAEMDDFASEDPFAVEAYMWTMGQFLLTTGHAHWADNIEDAIFNMSEAPVEIFRDYASRMWLTGSHVNEVVAALYGPSEAAFKIADDVEATITEDTAYPSGNEINFVFSMNKACKFPFSFRVPAWSKDIAVYVNGKSWKLGNSREKWESVSIDELNALEEAIECPECPGDYDYASDFYTIDRKFRDGDVVTLVLCDGCDGGDCNE